MKVPLNYLILSLCILLTSWSHSSEVIENFDAYKVGPISEIKAKSKGIAGKWSNSQGFEVKPSDIADWSGNALYVPANGKHLTVPLANEELLPMKPGSKVYVSFKFKLLSKENENAQALISFTTSQQKVSYNGLTFGQLWAGKTFALSNGPASTFPIDLDPHLVVIEVTRQENGGAQASLFMDPNSADSIQALKPDAIGWPKNLKINGLGFLANTNSFLVDDIIISPTVEQVFNP